MRSQSPPAALPPPPPPPLLLLLPALARVRGVAGVGMMSPGEDEVDDDDARLPPEPWVW